MSLMNRCPNCGGIAEHWITDYLGKCYYMCTQGMTTLQIGNISNSLLTPCDTVICEGKEFSGTIAYKQGKDFKTIVVSNGKVVNERR